MFKKSIFLVLACLSFVLLGCGRVSWRETRAATVNKNFKIVVTVSVSETTDPVIVMYAEDVKYDQEAGKLQVKNAYTSSNYDRDSNVIFIEEATFVFKFPTEVTIENLKSSNSQKIIINP